ncbi:hypothetical protein [Paracoccus aerodenitrificans]|uniref:hypothetical protein n=1 Tax=Paracoccus aerodenitrificans TaxID=3017781 RepID=UPI0022F082A2|nr:hypothetical protein [Paracoccus aerodenitrificans]WBU65220.1 hypothetical protein PAE61_07285 [Paracoccus aerodenitrificans]
MKFSTRVDRPVLAEQMFKIISDFERIERILMRRGASVQRVANGSDATISWDLKFDWRGQSRALQLLLVQFDRPEKLALTGKSKPFDMRFDLSVVALSRVKSRLIFEMEVWPRNMRARLAVQTAKLGKAQLDRKFAERVASFVDDAIA